MTTEQEGAPSASAGGAPAPDAVGTIRRVGERSFVLCDSPNGDRLWVQVAGGGHIVDGEFWRVDTRLVVGAVPGTPAARDPRDAEIDRLTRDLRACEIARNDARSQCDQVRVQRDNVTRARDEWRKEWERADAEVTRLVRCYDAVTARADSVEAERNRLRELVEAVRPRIGGIAVALGMAVTESSTAAEPRRWVAGDPEPEVGTTVTWGVAGAAWSRHEDRNWRSDACDCDSCLDAVGLPWSALLDAAATSGGLVEVVSTDG